MESKPLYTYLEKKTKNFSKIAKAEDRLPNFKELLTELPQKSLAYSSLLRDLEDHKNTISTNVLNYETSLDKLHQLPNSEITFLKTFLDRAQKKFYSQIQVDQNFLITGKEMLALHPCGMI